jgi:hypothetical protein
MQVGLPLASRLRGPHELGAAALFAPQADGLTRCARGSVRPPSRLSLAGVVLGAFAGAAGLGSQVVAAWSALARHAVRFAAVNGTALEPLARVVRDHDGL